MMAGGGAIDGKPILSPAAIQEMQRDQVGQAKVDDASPASDRWGAVTQVEGSAQRGCRSWRRPRALWTGQKEDPGRRSSPRGRAD
jgi:hypothetical protein